MSAVKLVGIGAASFVLGVLACYGVATLGWEHRALSSYGIVENSARDVARLARDISGADGKPLTAVQFQQRMLYRTQRLTLSAAMALPQMRLVARKTTVQAARNLQANPWVLAHDTPASRDVRAYILRWAVAHPLGKSDDGLAQKSP